MDDRRPFLTFAAAAAAAAAASAAAFAGAGAGAFFVFTFLAPFLSEGRDAAISTGPSPLDLLPASEQR